MFTSALGRVTHQVPDSFSRPAQPVQLRRAPSLRSCLRHSGHHRGDMVSAGTLPVTGRRHSEAVALSQVQWPVGISKVAHTLRSSPATAPIPFAAGGLAAPATVRDGSSYGRPSLLRSRSQLHTPQKRRGSVDQRVLILHRPPNSVPPNNAMHLTRREGATVRSLRPVVEARLAGDRGCWAGTAGRMVGDVRCSHQRGIE